MENPEALKRSETSHTLSWQRPPKLEEEMCTEFIGDIHTYTLVCEGPKQMDDDSCDGGRKCDGADADEVEEI